MSRTRTPSAAIASTQRRAYRADPGAAYSAKELDLAGTWDFKWPRNSVIRVAFKDLPDEDPEALRAARSAVIDLARLWETNLEAGGARTPGKVPLTLRFLDEPVSRSTTHSYDVLVSLEPLPIYLRRTVNNEGGLVFAPRSQLGSYAKRLDYGAPTTFLGPPQMFAEDPFEYYRTEEAKHFILHELGHVLGLPHAHQNPRLTHAPRWKSEDHCLKIIKSVAERFEEVSDGLLRHFIATQIREAWRDEGEFADWPKRDSTDPYSVMTYPTYPCMVEGSYGCPSTFPECLRFNTRPSDGDFEWLRLMYATPRSAAPGAPYSEVPQPPGGCG